MKIVEKNKAQTGTEYKTYIIIEASVFISEHIKISEGIVGRKVLKLDEEFWEDILHRYHKFVHEFIHLLKKI